MNIHEAHLEYSEVVVMRDLWKIPMEIFCWEIQKEKLRAECS